MTRRVPAVAVIRDAYAFLAAHLGAIIGLVWVPMVLLTVAQYFTLYRFYNSAIDALAGGNVAPLGSAILMVMACLVAALLFYAMMLVAVSQLSMSHQAPQPPLAHFNFGPLEWRMFRALFGFMGLFMMIGLTVMLAANAASPLLTGLKTSQSVADNIMLLAMIGVGLTLGARMLLLLPSLVIHETGPALRRAWMLSAGHFWSLFVILLAVFLPAKLFQLGVEYWLNGKNAIAVTGATPQVQMMNMALNARQILPLACGLNFLVSPIAIGLFAGASTSVWRALKE